MFVCHFHHVHPEKCPVRLIPQIIHACPYITTTQLLKHSIDVAKRQTAWIVSVHAVAIFYIHSTWKLQIHVLSLDIRIIRGSQKLPSNE